MTKVILASSENLCYNNKDVRSPRKHTGVCKD